MNGMEISCVCAEIFEMPLNVGDNGEFIDDGRLTFSWVCPQCHSTVAVHFEQNEIQFFKGE